MSGVVRLLASLVLPAIAGWQIVELLEIEDAASELIEMLEGRGVPSAIAEAGRLATGAVVGLGLSSLIAFGYLMAGGALDGRYVAIDAAAFAVVGAGAFWARRRRRTVAAPVTALGGARSRLDALCAALLVVALGVAAWAFVSMTAAQPHGEWDAWAVWNQRARFLLRAGTDWRRAFAPELSWSHTEYPLLLPLAVARSWAYAGESVLAPAVLAAAFTFAAPVALGAAVARAAGSLAGAAATLLLLGTEQSLVHGAMQFADAPVAALLVAALGVLVHAGRGDPRARAPRLVLAGLLLGLCGWTKNEGLAMAAWALFAHVAVGWRARGREILRDLAPLAAGAALPAAAWLAFHAAIVPGIAVELTGPDVAGASVADKLLDGARWRAILSHFARAFPGADVGLPAIAVGAAVALGARPRSLVRSVPLLTGLLLLCSFAVTFAITPSPLQWHLDTSATRVLIQPWPALLLGLFAAAAPTPALPPSPSSDPAPACTAGSNPAPSS